MNPILYFRRRFAFILLSGAVSILALSVGLFHLEAAPDEALMVIPSAAQNTAAPLCRFGVNVLGNVNQYDTVALRMGWYIDYSASAAPIEPNGADFAPVIKLSQIGPNDYDYSPNGSQLNDAIAGNPGAVWFIGNEPDRRDVQDDMEPHLYAEAYYELYHLIKTADPTAQIFAGTIVQPTPLRLQYLDMILSHYLATYGEAMPVDGWSIHNFILNEVSCDDLGDPENCWGAGIPPGIDDVYFGEVLTIDDNDNIEIFKERIERFRQWMFDNGYADKPLYVSEYGILMPDDLGFPPERVNAFMNHTFDYMLNATDPQIGYANDGQRLVQKWAWYSTGHPDDYFNGFLFEDADPRELSEMGLNFVTYTNAITDVIDLYPARIFSDPAVAFSEGESVTMTLNAIVANSGNLITSTEPINVAFYNGDPGDGGAQIGGDQVVQLSGCGDSEVVSVIWPDVPPGGHEVYVVMDTAVNETVMTNNSAHQVVLVATKRYFLPLVKN